VRSFQELKGGGKIGGHVSQSELPISGTQPVPEKTSKDGQGNSGSKKVEQKNWGRVPAKGGLQGVPRLLSGRNPQGVEKKKIPKSSKGKEFNHKGKFKLKRGK